MSLEGSTTFPQSYSPYLDPDLNKDIDESLNKYEKTLLIIYEVICTALTILFNSYLLYTILFKLKLNNNCVFIPMVTASVLGLFHGFGINLLMTISLILGNWPGWMEWCGASAVIHKYIVYAIIYCQVVICLEAAYLISHPHGYCRFSVKAKQSAILATFIALFVNLPITICQFFYLKPSQITEKYGESVIKNVARKYYFFDEDVKICFRHFFPGTLDYHVIVYFIHTCNLVAVVMVVSSYIIIICTVLKMRAKQSMRKHSTQENQEQKRVERQRRQNKKIALMSVLTTACVLTPWFFSLVISLLTDVMTNGLGDMRESLGRRGATIVLRTNQYMYYIVTWIFPVMTIMANSALSRATRDMLRNITSFELSSVVHSVAKINVHKKPDCQIHLNHLGPP